MKKLSLFLILELLFISTSSFFLSTVSAQTTFPTTAPEEPTIPPIPPDKAGDVDFLYDGQGQRIARLVSGGERTYYISPGLEVTVKADGSASWKRSYGATAVREGSSTGQKLSFIYSDHLGSTSQVYDDQGNVVAQQVYYPYGTTRSTAGILPTDKEYTGQMSDINETGLYYYNARYYNPTLAKFTQADQSADGLNKYAYVGNNPVNITDPSGNMQTPYDSGGGGGGSRKPKSPFSPIAPLDLGGSYNWSIQATSPISLEGGDLSPLENNIIFAGGSLFTAVTISPALPVLLRILPYLSLADTAYDTIGCVNKDPVSCFNISNPIPGVGIADDLAAISDDVTQFGDMLGRGGFGNVYANIETKTATKIFFDPNDPINLEQVKFMESYGGLEGIPAYKGRVPGGYQMELWDDAVTLEDFTGSGGRFSQGEVDEAVARLANIYNKTGMAHGDLTTRNILVRLQPGGKTVGFIDFFAFGGLLRDPHNIRKELGDFEIMMGWFTK